MTDCYNKCDLVSIEECDRLARLPDSMVSSCAIGLNFDVLLANIWDYLALVRVYTKKRGPVTTLSLPLPLSLVHFVGFLGGSTRERTDTLMGGALHCSLPLDESY